MDKGGKNLFDPSQPNQQNKALTRTLTLLMFETKTLGYPGIPGRGRALSQVRSGTVALLLDGEYDTCGAGQVHSRPVTLKYITRNKDICDTSVDKCSQPVSSIQTLEGLNERRRMPTPEYILSNLSAVILIGPLSAEILGGFL